MSPQFLARVFHSFTGFFFFFSNFVVKFSSVCESWERSVMNQVMFPCPASKVIMMRSVYISPPPPDSPPPPGAKTRGHFICSYFSSTEKVRALFVFKRQYLPFQCHNSEKNQQFVNLIKNLVRLQCFPSCTTLWTNWKTVKDRETWLAAVRGVTKSRTNSSSNKMEWACQ